MVALSRHDLEQMLSLLDLTTLESIDAKCRQDAYTFGNHPLLIYSAEALTEYASAIYRYILPHYGAVELTEEEYVAQWLAPHTNLQVQLASKTEDFIGLLRNIAETPTESEPNTLPPVPNRVYSEISDFLSGKNDDLYSNLNDFLFSSYSPLRRDTVTDARVLAIIAEVEAMRDAGNKALTAFVGTQLTLTQQASAAVYGVTIPKPKYGTELSRLRQLVDDRLAYYNLNPKNIALITAHKDRIPEADWATISETLESKVVTEEVRKLIRASVKAIKQAPTPITVTEEVDIFDTNELFIHEFMLQLEQAYSKPLPMTNNATLDDVFADIDAIYLTQAQGTSFEAVQDQQKSTEEWYYDYHNISQSLSAVLQIVLNDIAPNTVLSSDALSHGAIHGMLTFAEQLKYKYNTGTQAFDYSQLADELRHQLRVHTGYFTETRPLPELESTGREQLLNAQESTAQQVKLADTSFDITKPIQQSLNVLRPTIALTECEEISLSEVEIQSLEPVSDHTIQELLLLFAGKGTTPYLLRGDLLAHTKDGTYLKIIPTKSEDYVSYKFTAINGKVLNWLINKYCELLKAIPEYEKLIGYYRDPVNEIFGIAPQYDYDAEDSIDTISLDAIDNNSICTLQKLNDLLKARMHSSQIHLGLNSISEQLDSQTRCYWEDDALYKCLKSTVKGVYKELGLKYYVPFTKYYDPPYYISGHYLAEWVYDPAKYTDKITNGNGANSIDHIRIGEEYRSDNSKENLRIKPKPYNSGRTSKSIETHYNGDEYVSLSAYCKAVGLETYDYLQEITYNLNPDESFESDNRTYTLVEHKKLVVTDSEFKVANQITYKGKAYATAKAFADDVMIDYKSLHNALSSARKAGKSEFERKFKNKKYRFYLDGNGKIANIV
ncbi:MAG: hypothetical protein K0S76_156 [Herbinix sp.]|jgi:hypothetical protein|nr:hypothetical protein [Herbinix sp.]